MAKRKKDPKAANLPNPDARVHTQRLKDPEVLTFRLPSPRPKPFLALGLDLATSTGYAFTHLASKEPIIPERVDIHLGQLDLSAGTFDAGPIRFVRLRQFLNVLQPDIVFYEDAVSSMTPMFGMGAKASLWKGAKANELSIAYRTTVATWCEESQVPCVGFHIGRIKKRATGVGNAGKVQIIVACNHLFGSDLEPEGFESSGHDNVADAAFCLLLGIEEYGAGVQAAGTYPVPQGVQHDHSNDPQDDIRGNGPSDGGE